MSKRKLFLFTTLFCMLALGMAVSSSAYHIVGLDNFDKPFSYQPDVFSDVDSSQWYYENVASVYEYGLMNGKGDRKFDTAGSITIAETVAVGVRIDSIYQGAGTPFFNQEIEFDFWYTPYVDEALRIGLVSSVYPDYNAPATRAEFAKILAASINPVDLEEINYIDNNAIPDVAMNSNYADAVYLLYRAGVLTGSDGQGTFNPDSTITRAEAATIITRIVDPRLRKNIELVGEY